jgi:hypothetical protein
MNQTQFNVKWIDQGSEPQCPSDPLFPNGIDLDVSKGQEPVCTALLPYPAKRIGAYVIECTLCEIRVACTTAGRLDDPRSIKIPCKHTRMP